MAKKKSDDEAPRRPPKPRNRALPGLEHARYDDLDAFCEVIAKDRSKLNKLAQKGKANVAGAMVAMQEHKVTIYKHDGVELALVPGDAKLRVRLIGDNEGEGADGEGDGGDDE